MTAEVDGSMRSQHAQKVLWSGVVAAAGCYAGYVAFTYLRFGRVPGPADRNPLLLP
jgi:hypothetical protein